MLRMSLGAPSLVAAVLAIGATSPALAQQQPVPAAPASQQQQDAAAAAAAEELRQLEAAERELAEAEAALAEAEAAARVAEAEARAEAAQEQLEELERIEAAAAGLSGEAQQFMPVPRRRSMGRTWTGAGMAGYGAVIMLSAANGEFDDVDEATALVLGYSSLAAIGVGVGLMTWWSGRSGDGPSSTKPHTRRWRARLQDIRVVT